MKNMKMINKCIIERLGKVKQQLKDVGHINANTDCARDLYEHTIYHTWRYNVYTE